MIQLTIELEKGITNIQNSIIGFIKASSIMEWWKEYQNQLLDPNVRPYQSDFFNLENVKLVAANIHPGHSINLVCDNVYSEEVVSNPDIKMKLTCENSHIYSGEHLYYCIGNFPEYFLDKSIPIMINRVSHVEDHGVLNVAFHQDPRRMKLDNQRSSVKGKISELKNKVWFLTDELDKAYALMDEFPMNSILMSRAILEKCLKKVYIKSFGESLMHSPLAELRKNVEFRKLFKKELLGKISYVQRMGNTTSHSVSTMQSMTGADAQDCLEIVIDIVSWYTETYKQEEDSTHDSN